MASLFFYGVWNPQYVVLIIGSILVNYFLVTKIISLEKSKAYYFYFGLSLNLLFLGFFKYYDFFIENINFVFSSEFELLKILLPLGISFFTLQQIAYLVDAYQGLTKRASIIDYGLFVTFFPQLIAGPIVHYKDMLPQFGVQENQLINRENMAKGIYLFILGLGKKIILADTFATWAGPGFNQTENLHLFSAWATSLSYTFQLYFDFSGYSDMALGLGLMFNLKINPNFNSPFKARNVIEFWKRWHITLSEFINSYVFAPIVRGFPAMTFAYMMLATFLSMFISGLWHGAGHNYIFYGCMHGLALIINHVMKKRKIKFTKFWACFFTFNFINLSFTMFKAKSVNHAFKIYSAMFDFSHIVFPKGFLEKKTVRNLGMEVGHYMNNDDNLNLAFLMTSLFIVYRFKNSMELLKEFKPNTKMAFYSALIFVIAIFGMNRLTEFIYFNF